jgi:hypothetical protein
MILAAAGGVLGLFFAFQGDYDKAFLAATGGAVCWILNYRQQLREQLPPDDEEVEEDEDTDEEVPS